MESIVVATNTYQMCRFQSSHRWGFNLCKYLQHVFYVFGHFIVDVKIQALNLQNIYT